MDGPIHVTELVKSASLHNKSTGTSVYPQMKINSVDPGYCKTDQNDNWVQLILIGVLILHSCWQHHYHWVRRRKRILVYISMKKGVYPGHINFERLLLYLNFTRTYPLDPSKPYPDSNHHCHWILPWNQSSSHLGKRYGKTFLMAVSAPQLTRH